MRTLHDAYMTACGRKMPYEDLSTAEAIADRLTRQSPYGEMLTVYRCPFGPLGDGGHFHVGHVRGTKPKPAVLGGKTRWSQPYITFTGAAADLPQPKPKRRRHTRSSRRLPPIEGVG